MVVVIVVVVIVAVVVVVVVVVVLSCSCLCSCSRFDRGSCTCFGRLEAMLMYNIVARLVLLLQGSC